MGAPWDVFTSFLFPYTNYCYFNINSLVKDYLVILLFIKNIFLSKFQRVVLDSKGNSRISFRIFVYFYV